MQNEILTKRCLPLLMLFGLSGLTSQSLADDKTERRVESAKAIIRDMRASDAEAARLIAQMQATTQEAKSLNGQAHKYQSQVAPKIKPLTGARLAAAKMYQTDLEQFSEHAKAYRQHTESVHQQFGQCEASKRAYEKNKQAYALHMNEFHMPDVPPPHICIDLGAAASDSEMTQGKVRGTVKRMLDAQMDLMKTERDLKVAQKNSGIIDRQVRKQNEMNLQEQNLAAEFATLEEEYRQLKVEHKVLTPGGARTGVSTVHGRVKSGAK